MDALVMTKIKGVLLDFDGVLSSLVVRLGWPFYHALKIVKPSIRKVEILYSFKKITEMYLNEVKRDAFYVPKMMLKISHLLGLNYLQMFRFLVHLGILMKKNNNNIVPEEHADQVLKFLTMNYQTAIITHAEREVMEEAQKKFTFLKEIDVIIAQQDLKFSKPHPFGLNLALKKLGLQPKETIFVGDLPHDIQAGKRAGTHTCAVINFPELAKGKKMILQRYNPDFIIDHIKELPNLLSKIANFSL
jgi:HAD superfamily hydrolase (TIGR01509 family)